MKRAEQLGIPGWQHMSLLVSDGFDYAISFAHVDKSHTTNYLRLGLSPTYQFDQPQSPIKYQKLLVFSVLVLLNEPRLDFVFDYSACDSPITPRREQHRHLREAEAAGDSSSFGSDSDSSRDDPQDRSYRPWRTIKPTEKDSSRRVTRNPAKQDNRGRDSSSAGGSGGRTRTAGVDPDEGESRPSVSERVRSSSCTLVELALTFFSTFFDLQDILPVSLLLLLASPVFPLTPFNPDAVVLPTDPSFVAGKPRNPRRRWYRQDGSGPLYPVPSG